MARDSSTVVEAVKGEEAEDEDEDEVVLGLTDDEQGCSDEEDEVGMGGQEGMEVNVRSREVEAVDVAGEVEAVATAKLFLSSEHETASTRAVSDGRLSEQDSEGGRGEGRGERGSLSLDAACTTCLDTHSSKALRTDQPCEDNGSAIINHHDDQTSKHTDIKTSRKKRQLACGAVAGGFLLLTVIAVMRGVRVRHN